MVKLILRCACLFLVGSVAVASAATTEVSPTKLPVPKITSVSKITTTRLQTITIKGTGFGTFHAYTGTSAYIQLRDLSTSPVWEAGYSPDVDTVGLIVKSWTNTKIVLAGFGSAWGRQNWTLHKGNRERVEVWNWQFPHPNANSPHGTFFVTVSAPPTEK